ncbi:hypothetical protein SEA_HEXBUG_8 [Gordonia phage Hexbug]|nr:hypothetical protein SEA_HEXBUG_8 [Gordonia phage Hexbug]
MNADEAMRAVPVDSIWIVSGAVEGDTHFLIERDSIWEPDSTEYQAAIMDAPIPLVDKATGNVVMATPVSDPELFTQFA